MTVESECEGHKHNDLVFGGYRNVMGPRKGLLVSRCGFIWLPKRLRFYCGIIGSKWLGAATGNRTSVQIKCPHIIDGLPINVTTEDEELGTDHGCGWALKTIGPRTIDYNVGPLSRYWSAKL
jgi:hypothetical protein